MINYVNNSFDKVLKPCDAQQFMTLTQSEQTEKLIFGHRAGEHNSKAKLPALTYMGVLDEAKYKDYLRTIQETHPNPPCEGGDSYFAGQNSLPHREGRGGSPRPLGSRRAEFMRPTGLLMLDFDHVGDPTKLWQTIVQRHADAGTDMARAIALAHITPSGDGLRVVLKRTKDTTIEHDQWAWCELMKLDAKPDPACKDISRLSFAPMQSEVLYYNPSLLFSELPEASDYPDGTLWGGDSLRATLGTPPPLQGTPSINRGGVGGASTHPEGMQSTNCPSVYRGTSTECGGSCFSLDFSPSGFTASGVDLKVRPANFVSKQSAEQYPTDYNGVEYSEIIKRLEEQLGSRPEHGARNSFIFSMACNLRYVCNDDAAWIASILPTYGEDPQKHRTTIQSAVNRPMSREMPETLARALKVSDAVAHQEGAAAHDAAPPALPEVLPQPVSLLVEHRKCLRLCRSRFVCSWSASPNVCVRQQPWRCFLPSGPTSRTCTSSMPTGATTSLRL